MLDLKMVCLLVSLALDLKTVSKIDFLFDLLITDQV